MSIAPGLTQIEVEFEDNDRARVLFGHRDQNLKAAEKVLGVRIAPRGNRLQLMGAPTAVALARKLFEELYFCLGQGHPLHPSDVAQAADALVHNPDVSLRGLLMDVIDVPIKGRRVTPKSLAQKRYVDAIAAMDIVFGVGPAGTGKTYLAMAMAVAALTRKEVDRIVLCRPAVEAGERLGFLPGDVAEKVDPYLRPLYDALYDMMEFSQAQRLIERGTIEVVPLAFMRGRTLGDSFLILDEAQNTTPEQMKMFLTRVGINSKAVITGDVTQIDLPEGAPSGLVDAVEVLRDARGIGFVYFSEKDVMRHPLVQEILSAYEQRGAPARGARAGPTPPVDPEKEPGA